MTREQFLEAWQHKLSGLLCDAAMNHRTGAELAMFLRSHMKKLDTTLAAMYDSLQPKPNGKPATQPTKGTT